MHNETNKLNEKRQQRQSAERQFNAKHGIQPDPQAGAGEDSKYDNPFEADYYN